MANKIGQLNKIFAVLCLLQLVISFNLQILQPDVLEPMVFVNGKLTDYYNASVYEQHFVCTNGQLQIIEFQQSPSDQLIVFRYSGGQLTRSDINITVQPNEQPKPFIKQFNRVYKKFTLDAGCPKVITKQNYYNRIKVSLKIQEEELKKKVGSKIQRKNGSEIYQFSFLLNCDLWDVHKHFQYGYIFISIICITIVVFVSLHPRICSVVINNRPLNFEIKWKWFLLFMVIILSILGFIYSKKIVHNPDINRYFGNRNQIENRFQLANGFFKHLGLLSSLFYVYVCFSELFFEWNFLLKRIPIRPIKINNNVIVSKRGLVSGFISFVCYVIGFWCENWIYYNCLSFCIAIGAIKMFRFRSLRNGVYTMLIVLVSVAIFAVWSYFKLPRAVNDYASELSSPLFVEVPDLVNNLYKKCSWISIYDMILPGAVLAYLRDYDQNYHVGWKGVYTFISIISFSLSCLAWIIIEALIEYNIPFCIVIYPPFILAILVSAIYRNQFDTIWYGYFHFSMDLSIMQMIEQYRQKPKMTQSLLHTFPKDVLDTIKYQQSRWSDSQSMQMGAHRRALDDSQIEVWSASLARKSTQILPPENMEKKSLFMSQSLANLRKQPENQFKQGSSSSKLLKATRNDDKIMTLIEPKLILQKNKSKKQA